MLSLIPQSLGPALPWLKPPGRRRSCIASVGRGWGGKPTHSFMQQFMIELFASPKLPVRGRTGWESAEIAFQRRKQLMSPHIRISEWLD